MTDVIGGIPEIIEPGKKFTYANFSSNGPAAFQTPILTTG